LRYCAPLVGAATPETPRAALDSRPECSKSNLVDLIVRVAPTIEVEVD
jgi:hypothetical protein